MEPDLLALAERLDLDRDARRLWAVAVAHLEEAVRGEDEAFFAALEGAARSAALADTAPVVALLDAYNEGCTQLCRLLEAAGTAEARDACLRLRALDRAALSRIAAGYCAGLEEVVQELRRRSEAVGPVDPETGALRPDELVARLKLEVDRCRRADSPMGLVAFGLVPQPVSERRRPPAALEAARRLRAGVRGYDSLGVTVAGDFVVVMPDVSRRGLVAATERLIREVGRAKGRDPGPEVVCVFFHYDEVDTEPRTMLAALEHSLDEARHSGGQVAS